MHFKPTVTLAQQYKQSVAATCSPYSTLCNNLTYHGGPVLNVPNVYLIFWLPSGQHFETDNTGDEKYESLIEQYFTDVSTTSMHNILSQYYSTSGSVSTYPLNNSVLAGAMLDTTAYPHAGTVADPIFDSDIRARIGADITAKGWPTGTNNLYMVYTGNGIQSCYDAGQTTCSYNMYCAYHTYDSINNATVLYANEPDTYTTGGCSLGGTFPNDAYVDTALTAASHEYFEASTDPLLDAWYDQNGSGEIGDQCAYYYGTEDASGANVTLNGHPYQVQQEWSNAVSGCDISYTGQFINFAKLPSTGHQGDHMNLSAQATSQLPVSVASTTPSVCSVSGAQLSLNTANQTCTVEASQTGGTSGGTTYDAATPVDQSLSVLPPLLKVFLPFVAR